MDTKGRIEFTIVGGPSKERLVDSLHHNRKKKPLIVFRIVGKAEEHDDDPIIVMDTVNLVILDIKHENDDTLYIQGHCKVPLGGKHKIQENSNSGIIYTRELLDACFIAHYNPKTRDGHMTILV